MRGQWSVVGWSLNERKWIVDKCSEVEWSVAGLSVMKWIEGFNNKIRSLLLMWLFYLSRFFILVWFHFLSFCIDIYVCMFCKLLFNCVNCVFLFLCLCILIVIFMHFYCCVCSLYSVPLCCSVYCLCVNVYCTTATGCQPNCS